MKIFVFPSHVWLHRPPATVKETCGRSGPLAASRLAWLCLVCIWGTLAAVEWVHCAPARGRDKRQAHCHLWPTPITRLRGVTPANHNADWRGGTLAATRYSTVVPLLFALGHRQPLGHRARSTTLLPAPAVAARATVEPWGKDARFGVSAFHAPRLTALAGRFASARPT